jgi:hypothetical protein
MPSSSRSNRGIDAALASPPAADLASVVVAVVGALMGLDVTSAAVVAVAVVVMTVAVAAVAVVVAADAATSVVANLAFSFKTGTN